MANNSSSIMAHYRRNLHKYKDGYDIFSFRPTSVTTRSIRHWRKEADELALGVNRNLPIDVDAFPSLMLKNEVTSGPEIKEESDDEISPRTQRARAAELRLSKNKKRLYGDDDNATGQKDKHGDKDGDHDDSDKQDKLQAQEAATQPQDK